MSARKPFLLILIRYEARNLSWEGG